jgi:demethylmenaquinone methyltransferase/2-methoxy-6-polyprenyl-1,4-benzoquinol methylase
MSEKLVLPKSESWRMFDNISPRYDYLNRLLSFGLDHHWRKTLSKCLPNREDMHILDLATGTGDVLISLFQKNLNIESGVGLDMSEKMMEQGQKKIEEAGLATKIKLMRADASQIPFPDETFDLVTIAFGIRNMESPETVLTEIHRVLKPGGRTLILEFSLPKNAFLRFLSLFYLLLLCILQSIFLLYLLLK